MAIEDYELMSSRRVVPTNDGVTVIRYYLCPTSGTDSVVSGANGWVGQGGITLPVVGDTSTWTNATWTSFISSPTVETVDVTPRYRVNKALVKVVASARRKFA